MSRFAVVLALVVSSLSIGALAGCQQVDRVVDCHDICSRYRDCWDSSYDVDACSSRCRATTDSDGGNPRAANDCDSCLDGRSCSEAVFPCAAECSSIIP